eukprot:3896847-Heterocapsa_arctica.AAC.1
MVPGGGGAGPASGTTASDSSYPVELEAVRVNAMAAAERCPGDAGPGMFQADGTLHSVLRMLI